ncbi:30S ribosomal protein S2 [Candidatus Roizmanbacteria bacterium]|jgi:small subunit ribosomal protein S2|nr:30S ribosomal protein S2 [Candidatus Roizmanbacteria bacterium]
MEKIDPKIEALFKAGAHLGHRTSKVHPKAKKYIYGIENATSIIDLTKTATLLDVAKEFITKLAKENKVLLIVSTKKNTAAFAKKICQDNKIPHITVKWPGGFLTNFDTLMKNIKKMKTMMEEKENGTWQKYVKHEQVKLSKELNRLEKFYGGLIDMEKLPDALFVVDIKKEKNAVYEAKNCRIPVVAVTDTNVNPDMVDYPIPANDDSVTSIEYLINEVVDAYKKAKK